MNNNAIHLRANGKILLTGEYLVLDGAAALALPLIFNQRMDIIDSEERQIKWIAADINEVWFECLFSLDNFDIISSSDEIIASRLQKLLRSAASLNPLANPKNGLNISTHLNFNRFMGLGSSSTLISLIADLFQIDKFKLHSLVSMGSGYDVACTSFNHPIIYRKLSKKRVQIKPITFAPAFRDKLFFIWLGRKQDTDIEIQSYRNRNLSKLPAIIEKISEITFKITEVEELSNFASLIEMNEQLIASLLQKETLKEKCFRDFNGSIKSLGAWGGDFILAVSEKGLEYVTNYFRSNGFDTVYCFEDIVLNEKVIHDGDINIRF